MEFLTNLTAFSTAGEGAQFFSGEGDKGVNFATVTGFLEPFGKIAGAIAKLLGLVK